MIRISACVLLISLCASLQAQDTTYDWTGTGGFVGQITLDSPSSTDGGLSDVVSLYVQEPTTQYGPWATYPVNVTYPGGSYISGPFTFDNTTATLTGPFTWNASEITSMDIFWDPRGLDWLFLDAGAAAGSNSVSYVNLDAQLIESDDSGAWVADSVPDAGNTALLLGVTLAGLGALLPLQRKMRANRG